MKVAKSLGILVAALAATSAFADTVTISLDREFSGGANPSGPAPWLTATFTDTGANTVRLDLNRATTMGPTEFISKWLFNLNPVMAPTSLTIAQDSGPTSTWSLRSGSDTQAQFRGDGGSYFDVLFEFANSGAQRFDGDFTLASYTITGSGLTAQMFNDLGVGAGNSPNGLYTAAHVQAIGNDSGWVTGGIVLVPLPSAAWTGMAGLGLAGVVVARRRKAQ